MNSHLLKNMADFVVADRLERSAARQARRTFSRATGRGIAQHRVELRICAALDRLGEGEDNLARLAADLGFADHSHLTRTLHRHTDRTPSELRRQLRVQSFAVGFGASITMPRTRS